MALLKKTGRLAAAIGIAFVAESVLFAGAAFFDSKIPQPWGQRLAVISQEPGYHLLNWFANVRRPGFEEQAAYAMLIPLTQWMLWSVVFYLLLCRKKGHLQQQERL